ncbi:MAG TPA: hypothetical protein DHO02_10790 [Syntrophaceae bacterium]|nr:hypothetical protein [Syntrophaceae bacterium]HCS77705.1 hypothetical protein [Syntrophaceae bacterium]HCX02830.1 hypothetical protein [Syntrophaceae bacterium]
MSHYKCFDHTADIGVEVTGRTRKELLKPSSRTMMNISQSSTASGGLILRK